MIVHAPALAAGGSGSPVSVSGGNLTWVVIVAVIALSALAVAGWLVREVLAASQGTAKMQEIATAVQEGAAAYLRRQFRTLAVFAFIIPWILLLLPADGTSVRCFLPPDDPGRLTLAEAVTRARDVLRGYLSAYLDDHPDAVLQLTGGQDSRLLLSAIEPSRRRGLRVMTLSVPGNPDVEIAADLARRYSMDHEIIDLAGLDEIDPEQAHDRAVRAAQILEASADPLAYAGLDFAESRALPGPRLSGLGGADTFLGGSGADGADEIYGGPGPDPVRGTRNRITEPKPPFVRSASFPLIDPPIRRQSRIAVLPRVMGKEQIMGERFTQSRKHFRTSFATRFPR